MTADGGYDVHLRDYRLPPSMKGDPRLLDVIHESIVGSDEFSGDVDVEGTTVGQRAVIALQLVDAVVGNGGFEVLAEADRDWLRAAREGSELVGATEHQVLLESGDTERWLAREGLLRDRLQAYVESHEQEFFVDSDEAAATAERVLATFAAHDEWLAQTIEEIDRDVAGQKWLVQHFGDRGVYSETSALLLLRPDDMRQALELAADAGYEAHDLAFYEHVDAPALWQTITTDPISTLDAGVARQAGAWVAVELG